MALLRQCKAVTKEWEKNNRTKEPDTIQAIERKCQSIEDDIEMRRSSMESNWTLPSFSAYVLFAWLGGAKGIGLLLVLR
ncbi:hypothetical protein V6N12_047250 [Hibiscus sabdariffa]|uniref:Uncharacterized protein n=1 Tax=Hibiscus sabdariffa TaxID=183260 RepID=A0ABR2DAB6_9ROSI